MIPYYFYKIFNFNGKVLSHKISEYPSDKFGKYPYLKNVCKGLKLEFVEKKGKYFNGINLKCERSVIKYLFKNAKKIDILNLIHIKEETIRFGVLYKLLNRNGFLYLKLDSEIVNVKPRLSSYKYKSQFKGFLDFLNYYSIKCLNNFFWKKVDLISAETKKLSGYIKTNYPHLKHKTIFIPNGLNNYYIDEYHIEIKSFSEKENIILWVGSIGIEKKSPETLLYAIPEIRDLKDWKIILVGPIINNFDNRISEFFEKFPQLKDKVEFTGRITDRKELFEYYKRSKIFCMTSLHESFGFVLIEAAYFGNYIVSTDFPSAKEITLNGTLGTIFEQRNSNELALILENLINNELLMKQNYPKIMNHARNNYLWSDIIKKLYNEIRLRKNHPFTSD